MKNTLRKLIASILSLCLTAGITGLSAAAYGCGETEDAQDGFGQQVVFGAPSDLEWGEGDGSAEHPFEVSSAEHLLAIEEKGLGHHYIQTEGIDLADVL